MIPQENASDVGRNLAGGGFLRWEWPVTLTPQESRLLADERLFE
jgi:hypothetical protein